MHSNLIDLETVAVIIPTYNEKENIIELISQIRSEIGKVNIFVVDDSSPDGTQQLIRLYLKKNPKNLSLVTRKSKSGRGGAVLSGFVEAMKNPKINYFVEMDADFSHNPKAMKDLLLQCKLNTVSVASRYVQGSTISGWPLRRRVTSKLANWYIRKILGINIHDCTNGYRCYSRKAVSLILKSKVEHKGFIALSETLYLLFAAGFAFAEVPFAFVDRQTGKSNANFQEIFGSIPAIVKIRMKY